MLTEKRGTFGRNFRITSFLAVILVGSNLINYAKASVIIEETSNGRTEIISASGGSAVEIDNGKVLDVENLDPKDPRRKHILYLKQ